MLCISNVRSISFSDLSLDMHFCQERSVSDADLRRRVPPVVMEGLWVGRDRTSGSGWPTAGAESAGAVSTAMDNPAPANLTARRNLAQRIERSLASIEGAGRGPTQLEANHIATAIGCLRQDLCRDGEAMLHYAENGWGQELVEPSDRLPTVPQLRAMLAEAVGEPG